MNFFKKISYLMLIASLIGVNLPTIAAESTYIIESSVHWPEITENEATATSQTLTLTEQQRSQLEQAVAHFTIEEMSFVLKLGGQQISDVALGDKEMNAQGVIQLFIVATYFEQVQSKIIDANTPITIKEAQFVESSTLAKLPHDKAYSAETLLQLLVQANDQTALTVMIDYLGGINKINQQLHDMGFTQTNLTALADQMPPTTTANDVAKLLQAIEEQSLFDEPTSQKIQSLLSQHGPVGFAENVSTETSLMGRYQAFEWGMNDALLTKTNQQPTILLVLLANDSLALADFYNTVQTIMEHKGE